MMATLATDATVNGNGLAAEALTYNEWKFGERARQGAVTSPYALRVERDAFLSRFRPIYEDCVRELKRDDGIVGGFQPPFEGATQYPRLDELFLLDSARRMEMIQTFFTFDILRLCLTEENLAAIWLVQSIDAISPVGETIMIEGKACSLAPDQTRS